MKARYVNEMCAMMMVGDGLLTAVDPKRHLMLWRIGPKSCKRSLDAMMRHPRITRALGIAAAVAGVWWATRQKPARPSFFLRRSA